MAFIVSLFKYLILGGCALALIAGAVIVSALLDPTGPLNGAGAPYVIAGMGAGLVFMLLNLAGLAIVISLHDRHREIAEGVHRVATALEQRGVADRP